MEELAGLRGPGGPPLYIFTRDCSVLSGSPQPGAERGMPGKEGSLAPGGGGCLGLDNRSWDHCRGMWPAEHEKAQRRTLAGKKNVLLSHGPVVRRLSDPQFVCPPNGSICND